MKFDLYLENYIKNASDKQENLSFEDGYVLSGAIQLYLVNGNNEYKEFVKSYVECGISNDGKLIHDKEINNFVLGKSLFFLLEQTGEEKYKNAIENLMLQLETIERDQDNVFSFGEDQLESFLEIFSILLPFYTEYETKIGKKEKYNDIIGQFKRVRERIKEISVSQALLVKEFYLLALLESYQVISEQIFEHYKLLEDYIKELLKEEKDNSIIIAYGILKSCNSKALLKEKYQDRGIEILDSQNELKENLGEVTPENKKMLGTLMMAYAQLLMLRNEE